MNNQNKNQIENKKFPQIFAKNLNMVKIIE